MGRVRSKNTGPELRVRSLLHRNGFRFRLHRNDLPGNPDIVLPKYKTAIFVHGCFWHRHPHCRFATTPKGNRNFWMEKFSRNVKRDREVQAALRDGNWQVLVVWECELRDEETLARRLETALRHSYTDREGDADTPSSRRVAEASATWQNREDSAEPETGP